MKQRGLLNVKIDFEEEPLVRAKVKGVDGLYDLLKIVKKKMG